MHHRLLPEEVEELSAFADDEWGEESIDSALEVQAEMDMARALRQERERGTWRKGLLDHELAAAWDRHVMEKSSGFLDGARADEIIRKWAGPEMPPLECFSDHGRGAVEHASQMG